MMATANKDAITINENSRGDIDHDDDNDNETCMNLMMIMKKMVLFIRRQ